MRLLLLASLLLASAPAAFAQSDDASQFAVLAWPRCAPVHYATRLPCVVPVGFAVVEVEGDASAAMRYVQAHGPSAADPRVVIVPCFDSAPIVERAPFIGMMQREAPTSFDRP